MEKKSRTKEYSNGELTVVWKPGKCIHAGVCVKSLPQVYNPKERPWIKADQASTAELIAQIDQCPSGALTYYYNADGPKEEAAPSPKNTLIEISPNGPLIVHGKIMLKNAAGEETEQEKRTALCRCGASANKPYCDGAHHKINFQG